MTNLDSILKIRDITLPRKIHIVKTMDFPVVMYGCESWTMKAMLQVLPSKSFIVSSLTFKSLIHFEFILFCSDVFHLLSSNLHFSIFCLPIYIFVLLPHLFFYGFLFSFQLVFFFFLNIFELFTKHFFYPHSLSILLPGYLFFR